jgi:hypothetical protein
MRILLSIEIVVAFVAFGVIATSWVSARRISVPAAASLPVTPAAISDSAQVGLEVGRTRG